MPDTDSAVAASAIAIAAAQENRADVAELVAETAIENASEAIEDALEVAEEIAAAAMATELGRRINEVNERVTTWSDGQENLSLSLQMLQTQVQEMSGQISGLATALAASRTVPQHSTLPNSESPDNPVLEPIAELIPDSLAVEADAPAAPTEKPKRTRWI